jgi:CheY-like chemotaxis protein
VKTFLVVDDEPVILALVTTIVKMGHDRAIVAHNGFDALSLIEGGAEFDAVISDIRMPVMNGFDFIEEVRKRKPKIPILFMSGFPGPEVDNGILRFQQGKTQYLPKPFTPIQLLQALQTLAV